jgi:N-acetylmuramoyl-L-alanine amidase
MFDEDQDPIEEPLDENPIDDAFEPVDSEPEAELEAETEVETEVEPEVQNRQTIRGLVTTPSGARRPEAPARRQPRVTLQTLVTVIFAGIMVATLLTLWMPSAFTGEGLEEQYVGAISAVGQVTKQAEEGVQVSLPSEFPENKIGIIIGNKGLDDGEVCSNGLTELEINSTVASYLQQALIGMGYEAELLDETDPRLVGYQANLLIALHCNSCEYINDNATGFKFAIVPSEVKTIDREALTKCLSDEYAKATALKYHYQTTTNEIRNYHAFDQIDPLTAAMIFELGYMNLDQDILTNRPQVLAEGIANGIHCFMGAE